MSLTSRSIRLLMLARAASIFAIALGIRTWSDGSLEQYSGTALYASMAYTVVLFVLPRLAPLPAAGITIGFCWLVEVFQLTGVPAFLSAHSLLARLVLGVQFDIVDIAWYPVGVIPLAALDWLLALRAGKAFWDAP